MGANAEREKEIAANRRARLRPDYMGVDCPRCGRPITITNAGGYRTFCKRCVAAAMQLLTPSGEEGRDVE